MVRNYQIFKDKAATGTGVPMDTKDADNVTIDVAGGGSAVFTVKLQGSIQEGVNFSAAQSPTNRWDYIEAVDCQSGSVIAGDTGLTFSAGDVRLLTVNTNKLNSICATVTAYTSGTLTMNGAVYNLRGIC